jgi:hypothetical protein
MEGGSGTATTWRRGGGGQRVLRKGGGPTPVRTRKRRRRRPIGHSPCEVGEIGGSGPMGQCGRRARRVGRYCCGLGPIRTVSFFIYSKNSKGSDMIRLKDGLPEF